MRYLGTRPGRIDARRRRGCRLAYLGCVASDANLTVSMLTQSKPGRIKIMYRIPPNVVRKQRKQQ